MSGIEKLILFLFGKIIKKGCIMNMGQIKNKDNVVSLHLYEVFKFFWGSAVKEKRTGKWIRIFIAGDELVEVNLTNLNVEIHENGIEFL